MTDMMMQAGVDPWAEVEHQARRAQAAEQERDDLRAEIAVQQQTFETMLGEVRAQRDDLRTAVLSLASSFDFKAQASGNFTWSEAARILRSNL